MNLISRFSIGKRARSTNRNRLKRNLIASSIIFLSLLGAVEGVAAQEAPNSSRQSTNKPPQADLPDSPGAVPKELSPSPVQTVEDETKKAAELTGHAATEELLRARDWEATWIEGVYVGKHQQMRPLNARERREIYLRQTFTTPQTYMKRMFAAGIDQARGVPAQWDDGVAGYAERFASREGQFITANSIAALGNAKLGDEVRYDKCRCERVWPRVRHAILRNFLTYDRTEETMVPQFALYGGAFTGGLVSTSWKPSPKNAWANGGWAVLGQAGYGTLLNLVIEFSREINEKQGVK